MQVRRLTLVDCQAVADLESQLFDGRFTADDVRRMLNKPAFFGAVVPAPDNKAEINAYILAMISNGYADIIAIGTRKKMQRCGYGRLILQDLIDGAKDRQVENITLEVASDNLPAISLYESAGFVECGRRKNYYKRIAGTCDGIVMMLSLASAFS